MATAAPTTHEMRPSRRDLLSAAGFTGLTAVAVAGFARGETLMPTTADKTLQSDASPDAELISLCAYFDELERQTTISFVEKGDGPEGEQYRDDLQGRQQALLHQIIQIRGTTMEGAQARARMLHLWYEGLQGNAEAGNYWNEKMIWALVRDLVGAA